MRIRQSVVATNIDRNRRRWLRAHATLISGKQGTFTLEDGTAHRGPSVDGMMPAAQQDSLFLSPPFNRKGSMAMMRPCLTCKYHKDQELPQMLLLYEGIAESPRRLEERSAMNLGRAMVLWNGVALEPSQLIRTISTTPCARQCRVGLPTTSFSELMARGLISIA